MKPYAYLLPLALLAAGCNAYEVDLAGDELVLRYEATGTTVVNFTDVVEFEAEIEVSLERE